MRTSPILLSALAAIVTVDALSVDSHFPLRRTRRGGLSKRAQQCPKRLSAPTSTTISITHPPNTSVSSSSSISRSTISSAVSSSSVVINLTTSKPSSSSKSSASTTTTKIVNVTVTKTATLLGNNTSQSTTKSSSPVSSTSSSSTATPTPALACPPGSSYQTMTDNFATFDTTKWTREAGPQEASTFGKDGLIMTLSQSNQNIVYQSVKQWVAPVSMSVTMKSAQAPGIVSCAIFKNADASDEIDLELVENSWQVPLWQKAQRVEFGKDAKGSLAQGVRNHTSWVYSGPDGLVPFQRLHTWAVDWNPSNLTWFADGNKMLSVNRLSTAQKWPTQPLHVRFGPWVAGLWAGRANFTANPHPQQQISRITVKGCMIA